MHECGSGAPTAGLGLDEGSTQGTRGVGILDAIGAIGGCAMLPCRHAMLLHVSLCEECGMEASHTYLHDATVIPHDAYASESVG